MKNTLDKIYELHTTEKKINKLEIIEIETLQYESKRDKQTGRK